MRAGGRGWTRFIGVVGVGLTLGISAPGAAQEPARPGHARVIVGHDGRLTVRAHGVRLAELLRVIASRSGVGVAAVGDLDARVTADLDGVEAGEAIRRLAKDHATVWIAQPARGSASRLLSDSPDARVRARAVMALGAVKTAQAAAALRTALGDSAPSVRIQAAYALRRSRGTAAIPLLAQVATNDPDPQVRRAVARALSALRAVGR